MKNHPEQEILSILARSRDPEPKLLAPGASGCLDITLLMDTVLERASPDEARRVEDHAAGCADCRTRLAAYRAFLANEPVVEPSYEGSLLERVAERREFVPKPRPQTPSGGGGIAMSPSVTELIRSGRLEEFERRVRPWLPVWLMSVAVDESLTEQLLEDLKSRLWEMAGRRFREALAVWLPNFAREHSGAGAWDPDAREARGLWRTLRRETPDEAEWAADYRRLALRQRLRSKAEFRAFAPDRFAAELFFEEYKNDLLRETDTAIREEDELLTQTV